MGPRLREDEESSVEGRTVFSLTRFKVMTDTLRAIFFDAGNTLIYPRVEELAKDLTEQGYPATAEDFFAAEREGKARLDEWLWPKIRQGQVQRQGFRDLQIGDSLIVRWQSAKRQTG